MVFSADHGSAASAFAAFASSGLDGLAAPLASSFLELGFHPGSDSHLFDHARPWFAISVL